MYHSHLVFSLKLLSVSMWRIWTLLISISIYIHVNHIYEWNSRLVGLSSFDRTTGLGEGKLLNSKRDVQECGTLVHHSLVTTLSKMSGWFYTNLHHNKWIICVGNPTVHIFNQTVGLSYIKINGRVHKKIYISKVKVGNHSWGQPEGFHSNSYDTEV